MPRSVLNQRTLLLKSYDEKNAFLTVKTLYLDIFSGISGDMFVGALIDLGVDVHQLERELAKLGLRGYHLHSAKGQKASIAGIKFDVHLEDDHSHQHRHPRHKHGDPVQVAEHAHNETGPHGGPLIKTSLGDVEVSVFETNVPPRFRLYLPIQKGNTAPKLKASDVQLEVKRRDGARQTFKFKQRGNCL